MKNIKLVFVMLFVVVFGVSGQMQNPRFVSASLDFSLRDSVDQTGNLYITAWSQRPSLLTLVSADGSISLALSNENAGQTGQTFIYEYNSGLALQKTVQIPNERALLGAFTKDTEGNYYIFYAANAKSQNDVNMAMGKYDADGKKLLEYTLVANAPDSFSGIREPFNAGTCRLELSGDNLCVYFAREMFNGHQASYGFVLDKNTFERIDKGAATNDMEAPRRVMPYVSHSFNQYIVPVENGFVFADHGDAHPRAFGFSKWQTNDRTKRLKAFTFAGSIGANPTYAEMGGLAKTSTGFIFAGTNGGGANNPRNLFILTFPDDLSAITINQNITAYARDDGHVAHPKIAEIAPSADGTRRYILLWELMEFSTQSANSIVSDPTGYKSTWFILIDETGKALTGMTQMPEGVRLNMNDTLRYNPATGELCWAVNVGAKGFGIWAFNPDKPINAHVDVSMFDKPETAAESDFSYKIIGNAGQAQTVSITGYKGSIRNLIIPDTIQGLPVTEIASNAFIRAGIETVQLPKGLVTIADTAFWYCNITALDIPNGVISIGKQAFSFCRDLQTVSIPASIETVREFAFMDCPKLTTVTIDPACDMTLGYGAFDKCPALDAASKAVIGTY
ncbi:MAG: leucine-rich repeat domain-containing protein [Spirochaetaceae bacterium]|jgi:hypothetical protein|nr:leucine-rich repeat domain-containing protein [Spirochaetaceae bacterium]